MTSRDIVWYSRSAHPSPLGLAAQLGSLIEEFRDDQLQLFTVQDSPDAALRESHVDHHLKNFIRQGGNATALWARSNGAPTRLLGLNWMEEFQGIVSLSGGGVDSVADLAGRTLALPLASTLIDNARAEALHGFLAALKLADLGAGDVTFVDVPVERPASQRHSNVGPPGPFGEYARQMTALLRHEVDVVYVKGARGVQACRAAQAHVVFDLRRLPDKTARVHNGAPRPITVDESLLQSQPQVVERFLARVVAAGAWAARHPRETLAYLARETRRSEELVLAAYGDDVHLNLATDLSATNLAALAAHKRFLLDWGFLTRDFDLAGWIDTAPLAAAIQRAAALEQRSFA